jgi:hypothetical protein
MKPFAQVLDVPASWATYVAMATFLGDDVPDGLLVHAAGRTDEGFRTIELWSSKGAWDEFSSQGLVELRSWYRERAGASPTLRELEVEHIVRGERR